MTIHEKMPSIASGESDSKTVESPLKRIEADTPEIKTESNTIKIYDKTGNKLSLFKIKKGILNNMNMSDKSTLAILNDGDNDDYTEVLNNGDYGVLG